MYAHVHTCVLNTSSQASDFTVPSLTRTRTVPSLTRTRNRRRALALIKGGVGSVEYTLTGLGFHGTHTHTQTRTHAHTAMMYIGKFMGEFMHAR